MNRLRLILGVFLALAAATAADLFWPISYEIRVRAEALPAAARSPAPEFLFRRIETSAGTIFLSWQDGRIRLVGSLLHTTPCTRWRVDVRRAAELPAVAFLLTKDPGYRQLCIETTGAKQVLEAETEADFDTFLLLKADQEVIFEGVFSREEASLI